MPPRKRKGDTNAGPTDPGPKPKAKPRPASKGKILNAKETRECKEAFFAGTKGKRLQEDAKASATAARKQQKKDLGLG